LSHDLEMCGGDRRPAVCLGPGDELGLVHFGTDVEVVPRRRMNADGQAAMDAARQRAETACR
jgi:hypothetical protein